MAKILSCKDLVPGCKFEARGIYDEDVITDFADHLETAHSLLDLSDEIVGRICKAIHEEVRVPTRAASG